MVDTHFHTDRHTVQFLETILSSSVYLKTHIFQMKTENQNLPDCIVSSYRGKESEHFMLFLVNPESLHFFIVNQCFEYVK